MFTKLKPVWLVAGRELKDQFRDWRVLTPMAILIFCFPILMNEFAKQTVNFLNQYNANLILERLVPFSIMIIGFFPITISLVVALESFVGEKERGTIEPMLSAPLDNWQLYFGKLLVGVITPLIASYLSIAFYLVMITRQDLVMPSFITLVQLILLTTAHATLMVSAAIVISVQSTTVKAANLLASFIVIPVAILMQGEAVMLFWGNDQVLWLAISGVMIISLLLIRVGIAHFQREYLLGREIDTINVGWLWRTFWKNFIGGANSLEAWYVHSLGSALRRIVPAILFLAVVAVVSVWLGHAWVMQNIPQVIAKSSPEDIQKLTAGVREMPNLTNLEAKLNAPFLFMNNTRAVAIIFLAGLFSFSVLGVLLYMVNIALMGGLFGVLQLLGISPWPLFLAGVVPHGVFEIPALMIGSAAMLYMGVVIVTPQTGKSMGEVILESLADWTKVFLGIVVPLLAIAAVIEAYLTPLLLAWVLK
ncbi:MAG: stage II sporulation protein M [Chloroflexi bacterium]|nr:stage II sporulation protein M [Chloroflexota bacterium]